MSKPYRNIATVTGKQTLNKDLEFLDDIQTETKPVIRESKLRTSLPSNRKQPVIPIVLEPDRLN